MIFAGDGPGRFFAVARFPLNTGRRSAADRDVAAVRITPPTASRPTRIPFRGHDHTGGRSVNSRPDRPNCFDFLQPSNEIPN